ncbi:MAG: nitroreductase family protein, partial [Actinomycetota bacterium]|nr:nitroreductase family protein [Actinomycetota bacterium]
RWAFIVCRDREHLRQLGEVGPWAGHLAGAAVAIALVTPDPARDEAPLSLMFALGQAADSMMLAAWELGIGSCHASVYDEPRVRELLGYPPEMTCDLVVSFGYPDDPASLASPGSGGGRKPLPDLRHEERFGGGGLA